MAAPSPVHPAGLGGFTTAQVAALRTCGMGVPAVRRILAAYPDLDTYLSAGAASWAEAEVAVPDAVAITGVLEAPVTTEGRWGDGWVLAVGEDGYSPALAAAPNPPQLLFGRGNRDALAAGLAVVGTRQVTELGRIITRVAVDGALAAGVPVHSGLAVGCDSLAHQGALAAGLPTVAVLAAGTDSPSPGQTAPLAEQILAAGGALVSEHPFALTHRDRGEWARWLMARNRIIVGLSAVIVPAEASLRSGTMGAVWGALAADRPLVVARPRPHARTAPGAAAALLLSDPLIRSSADLVEAGCPTSLAQAWSGRKGPLAHGVAEDRDQLVELIRAACLFSPWL